jgi:hypothetical protein
VSSDTSGFVAALIVALALFTGAALVTFFHPSGSYVGQFGLTTSVQCISAWDRMTGNAPYGPITNVATLDANTSCSHRIDAMETIAGLLVLAGVVMVIVAFVWRRRRLGSVQ